MNTIKRGTGSELYINGDPKTKGEISVTYNGNRVMIRCTDQYQDKLIWRVLYSDITNGDTGQPFTSLEDLQLYMAPKLFPGTIDITDITGNEATGGKFQFTGVAGQLQFPLPGDPQAEAIRDALKSSKQLIVTNEQGVMWRGNDIDQYLYDPAAGTITFNQPIQTHQITIDYLK